eukprot:gene944-biopygen6471
MPAHRRTPPVGSSHLPSAADPVRRPAHCAQSMIPGRAFPGIGRAARPEARRVSTPGRQECPHARARKTSSHLQRLLEVLALAEGAGGPARPAAGRRRRRARPAHPRKRRGGVRRARGGGREEEPRGAVESLAELPPLSLLRENWGRSWKHVSKAASNLSPTWFPKIVWYETPGAVSPHAINARRMCHRRPPGQLPCPAPLVRLRGAGAVAPGRDDDAAAHAADQRLPVRRLRGDAVRQLRPKAPSMTEMDVR